MKKIVTLSLVIAACASQAQVLVETGFENNTLGAILGQAAENGRIWQGGSTGVVVDSGPTIGSKALIRSGTLTNNSNSYFNWIDVFDAPATGVNLAVGNFAVGSVSVYVDSQNAGGLAGLSAWANDGANLHGLLLLKGNGEVYAGTGTGTAVRSLVSGASAVLNAWNLVEIIVTQTSADTLTSTYRLNGATLTGVSHTRTVTPNNRVSDFDLMARNESGATASVNHRWDNYKVEAVPEPATLAALGLGVAAMLRRKKK